MSIAYLGTGADDLAMANKVYTGSVVEAFRQRPVLYNLPFIQKMNVRHSMGKSFQFIMEGDAVEPEPFAPGTATLEGQPFAFDEGTITADDLIVAHRKLREDQTNIADPTWTSNTGAKLGARTIRYIDRRLFRIAVNGARAAAVNKNGINIHNGGNRVRVGGYSSMALAFPATPIGARRLIDNLAELAQLMDYDNVPAEGRGIFLHSSLRSVLTRENGFVYGTPSATTTPGGSTLFSSDYQSGNDLNSRTIMMVEGFRVLGFVNGETQGGPFPDTSTNANLALAKYQGDYTPGGANGQPAVIAVAQGEPGMYPLGAAIYKNLTTEMEYIKRQKAWYFDAHMQAGFGVMHPWLLGVIDVTTVS
jgi:hypothetical protein